MVVFKINSIIMKKSLLFLAVLFVLTGCQKESILPETDSTPRIFAAISPVAGSLYEGIETTSIAPVSVLMIHGEQDNSVPYEGGYSHGYVFYSAQQTAQIWSINNGCNASPVISTDIPGAKVYDYSGCDNNKDVILFSVPNSGHDVFSEFQSIDMFNYVFDFFGNQTL
jgi:poly(3-hydroxybutyrate) depolymerase